MLGPLEARRATKESNRGELPRRATSRAIQENCAAGEPSKGTILESYDGELPKRATQPKRATRKSNRAKLRLVSCALVWADVG